MQASARLRHRDPATTPRTYPTHSANHISHNDDQRSTARITATGSLPGSRTTRKTLPLSSSFLLDGTRNNQPALCGMDAVQE
jgi:hypothetical protein